MDRSIRKWYPVVRASLDADDVGCGIYAQMTFEIAWHKWVYAHHLDHENDDRKTSVVHVALDESKRTHDDDKYNHFATIWKSKPR